MVVGVTDRDGEHVDHEGQREELDLRRPLAELAHIVDEDMDGVGVVRHFNVRDRIEHEIGDLRATPQRQRQPHPAQPDTARGRTKRKPNVSM